MVVVMKCICFLGYHVLSQQRPHTLCMFPWSNQGYGRALHTQLRTVEACLCPFPTPVFLVFDLDYLVVVSHLASSPLSLAASKALLLILCSLCSLIYTIILELYHSRASIMANKIQDAAAAFLVPHTSQYLDYWVTS